MALSKKTKEEVFFIQPKKYDLHDLDDKEEVKKFWREWNEWCAMQPKEKRVHELYFNFLGAINCKSPYIGEGGVYRFKDITVVEPKLYMDLSRKWTAANSLAISREYYKREEERAINSIPDNFEESLTNL